MPTRDDGEFKVAEFSVKMPKLDMDRLRERARAMVANGESQITGGKFGEPVLAEWQAKNKTRVTQRPDDEQDICRISVGGGIQGADLTYAVFRGDRIKCAFLLEMAAAALREGPMVARA